MAREGTFACRGALGVKDAGGVDSQQKALAPATSPLSAAPDTPPHLHTFVSCAILRLILVCSSPKGALSPAGAPLATAMGPSRGLQASGLGRAAALAPQRKGGVSGANRGRGW